MDECFCALTLVDQFGSLRYLYHQCLSLLSCCQLTYSFHDSMSGRRSQAPRQPPPSLGPPPAAPSSDQHRRLYPAACLHHCTDLYGFMQFLAVPWGSGHALLQANSNTNSLVSLCTPWCPCRRHKAEHNSTPNSLRRSPAQ